MKSPSLFARAMADAARLVFVAKNLSPSVDPTAEMAGVAAMSYSSQTPKSPHLLTFDIVSFTKRKMDNLAVPRTALVRLGRLSS